MSEILIAGLISIPLSIIANLLTPYVRSIFNIKQYQDVEEVKIVDNSVYQVPSPDQLDQWRQNNREQLYSTLWHIFLYAFSFYIVVIAFYLPLVFKFGFTHETFSLSTTRLGLNINVAKSYILWIAIIAGGFVYIPCWILSQKFAYVTAKIWTRFHVLDYRQYGVFIVYWMLFLGLIIAGHLVFFLYPNFNYIQSLLLPFSIFVISFLLFISKNK